jgi:hypothetical protein
MAVNTINRPKTTKPIQLGGDVELELLALPLSPCGVGMASDMAGILDSLIVVIKTVVFREFCRQWLGSND